MKFGRNIVLYLSLAFLIIGIHQTITLGFEVSYWIFMITISLYLLYRLMGQSEAAKKSSSKSSGSSARSSSKFIKGSGKSSKTKGDDSGSSESGKGLFGFLKGSRNKNQPKMNRRAKRYMEKTGYNG